MGLRIIYGRAGTGKSEFCFKEISDKIQGKYKIYIITPEQFSFNAEERLLKTIKSNAVINAEVLTFKRMAYRISSEIGYKNKKLLSDSGKYMLLYDILEKNKGKLRFLGKSDKNIELVDTSITEFKKHNVNIEILNNVINKTENLYLKYKLEDMYLLYNEFQERIKNSYLEDNDLLTNLYEDLDKTNMFKNTIIYLDEFSGFTPQEYNIIKKLMKIAKQVNITICTDKFPEEIISDMDLFYSNKVTLQKIINLTQKEKINIEKPVYLNIKYRFKSPELLHIEDKLYEIPYKKYQNKCESLSLYLSTNPYTEIKYVANKIIELVKEKNYRYRDIAIITKNIESYASLTKAIFSQYEIPIFIDQKKDLNQNLLVKYILALLEVFNKNWSYEAMFQYIKIGLCDISDEECFRLENYCLKWGIKYSRWYKEDWKFEDDKIDEINRIRKLVVDPLLLFKKQLDGRKTYKEITEVIYNFLIQNKIGEKLINKAKELEKNNEIEISKEYIAGWDIVISVLKEIIQVFGNEQVSFEKYADRFKVGIKATGIGKIPVAMDQVTLGDIERSRSHKVKAVFIIGVNDGSFPEIRKEEGFFNDKDRENLKIDGIELAKGTNEIIFEENFNIYKALTTAEENIFLSYISTDSDGKALRPSILISKIKKIFTELKEDSDVTKRKGKIIHKNELFFELLLNIRNWTDGEEIIYDWYSVFKAFIDNLEWKDRLLSATDALKYTNKPDILKQDNVQKLYGDVLKTSVSKLEQYRSCPFAFFLKYGLALSDKELFKIESIDTGSFMHEVIDVFFEYIRINNLDFKTITNEQMENKVEEIIQDKLKLNKNYIFVSTPKYQFLTRRLTKLIIKSIKHIINTLVYSDYKIIGNEVEFKDGGDYAPIKIQLDDGRRVELTGKIDRVDLAKTKDGNYIRVIDYKSSVKNIDLNEVTLGIQIQLLTYLNVVTNEELLPSGALYFNLIDPILKAERNITQEELEDKIKNEFKMKGLILADIHIVKMMDNTLEKGSSNIIPAYIDSKGELNVNKPNMLTKEQFKVLQNNIYNTIKDISEEILSGQISLEPYYNRLKKKTPCEYCRFHSICKFTPGFCENKYKYIGNKTKEEIINEISNVNEKYDSERRC